MTSTTPGNGNNNDKQISMLFCGVLVNLSINNYLHGPN